MQLLDLIFPKRCVGCGKWGKYFCSGCTQKLPFLEFQICPMCFRPAIDGITHPKCQTRYSLDGLTAIFHYRGIIRNAIKKVKYRLVSDLAQEFVNLISVSIFNSSILVPIPLHPSRLRFRGFNQAEVLGNQLAKRLQIPIRTDMLKRIKITKPQVEMKKRDERLENMRDVFSISSNSSISQYPNIMLFDDVSTTGATLRSAANVLKRAGAKKVWGIVMAHG